MMIKTSAWFVFFLLLTVSCLDEPDCYQLNNQYVGISFKKLADSSTDTIAVLAVGSVDPPILFGADTSFTRAAFSLNYFADETTYFFQDADTSRILRLGYISQAQFVSENCGEKFVLSELQILEHSFDSVRLISDVPTAEPGIIQIEIFQ